MSNTIFFIDTEYSNQMIASRPIKQYAVDNITNYLVTTTISPHSIVLVKSNLIGLTDEIVDQFIKQKAEQEILVGALANIACMIGISGKLLSTFLPNAQSFDDAINSEPAYDLTPYPLKLLNNMTKMVAFEQEIQNKLRQSAIDKGVFLQDPATTYLAFDTEFGNKVLIEPNVYFGTNVKLHDHVHIRAFSYLEKVEIESGAKIGPFARIRGDSRIGNNVKIGNFVEIKNSILDAASSAAHLSYIGDSIIGKNVNIGAGVVTCNYDGFKKYQTIIADDTFVGSNSSLIAPITIGTNSFIGAGSFINQNVPNNTFASGRSKQQMKPNRRK